MTQAIQRTQSTQLIEAERDSLEIRVALNQNLWGMADDQVWTYYRMMCGHLRIDPASKPFDIITDAKQQQKKLYPNTSCTSQLGDNARLSYGKLDIDVNEGLAALGFKVAHVSIEVRHPNGRTLVAEAFVDLMSGYEGQPLKGNNLVNALKKAGTQCRRRGTLQMLGLAAPEKEIPTVTLGELERTEGDTEGVIIEHPPASALNPQHEPRQIEQPKPETTKGDSGKLNSNATQASGAQMSAIDKTLLTHCIQQKGRTGGSADANYRAGRAFFDARYAKMSDEQKEKEVKTLGLTVLSDRPEVKEDPQPAEVPAAQATAETEIIETPETEVASEPPSERDMLLAKLDELLQASYTVNNSDNPFYDEVERQTGARSWTGKTSEELQTLIDGMTLYYKSLTAKKKR